MKWRSRAGTTQHQNSQHHLTHKSSRTQMKCAWLVAWCHWAIQLSICPRLDDVAPRWLAASWENEIIFLFDIISGGSGWNLYSWKCGFIFCVNLTERNVLLQPWYRKDFDKTAGNAKHGITRPLLYILHILHQHLCDLHEYHFPLAITPVMAVMAGILFWILNDFGMFGPFCFFTFLLLTWVARSIEVLLGSQRSAWHVCRFVWETGQKASGCITHARQVHLFVSAHLMVLFARLSGELSFGLLWWLRTAQGEVGYQCVAL